MTHAPRRPGEDRCRERIDPMETEKPGGVTVNCRSALRGVRVVAVGVAVSDRAVLLVNQVFDAILLRRCASGRLRLRLGVVRTRGALSTLAAVGPPILGRHRVNVLLVGHHSSLLAPSGEGAKGAIISVQAGPWTDPNRAAARKGPRYEPVKIVRSSQALVAGVILPASGPRLLMCTGGEVALLNERDEVLHLRRGDAAYAGNDDGQLRIVGTGEVAQAYAPGAAAGRLDDLL